MRVTETEDWVFFLVCHNFNLLLHPYDYIGQKKERKKVKSLSHVQLFATLWTVAHQAPLSMGFSRPEYWSGLPCPPPGDLPNPGTEPMAPVSSASQVDSLPISHWGSPRYTYTSTK